MIHSPSLSSHLHRLTLSFSLTHTRHYKNYLPFPYISYFFLYPSLCFFISSFFFLSFLLTYFLSFFSFSLSCLLTFCPSSFFFLSFLHTTFCPSFFFLSFLLTYSLSFFLSFFLSCLHIYYLLFFFRSFHLSLALNDFSLSVNKLDLRMYKNVTILLMMPLWNINQRQENSITLFDLGKEQKVNKL